ncbi:MAG: glycosyltransferase [Chloroflexota bacterium]
MITRLAVSGVATHVTLANQGLTRRGWDTLLAHGSVQPDELEIELPVPDVAEVRIESLARPIRPAADLRASAALVRLIKRYRPDLVHTHHSKAGILGRSVSVLAGVPCVHTYHGHVFEGYFGEGASEAIQVIERVMARRTARLIAISPIQRDDLLARGIGTPDRFEVVPLGLDLTPFGSPDRLAARADLGIPADAFVVLMVGRVVAIKRIDRMIRAFAGLHAARPDARLYVIGDGAERPEAEAQVLAAGLQDAVVFCGWQTATARWYAAADLVALSSDNEGTPLALIEAAASRRPVVSTAVGGVADVVRDGVTGLLVPVDDESGLAAALRRLADDESLRERMGAAGPAVAAAFGSDRLVDDLERIYRRILDGDRSIRGRT